MIKTGDVVKDKLSNKLLVVTSVREPKVLKNQNIITAIDSKGNSFNLFDDEFEMEGHLPHMSSMLSCLANMG